MTMCIQCKEVINSIIPVRAGW